MHLCVAMQVSGGRSSYLAGAAREKMNPCSGGGSNRPMFQWSFVGTDMPPGEPPQQRRRLARLPGTSRRHFLLKSSSP